MINKIKKLVSSINEKRKNKVYKRNEMVKEILFVTIWLLLIFAGIRSYSLYNFYNHATVQDETLDEAIEDGSRTLVKEFLLSSYRNAYYHNRTDAYNLQTSLIEEHGVDKVYDNLVNGKFGDGVFKTFMETFNNVYVADESNTDNVVIVGNDEGVIYSKSNNKLEKFIKIKKDNKKMISWKEFFSSMEKPNVTEKGFVDSYRKSYTKEPIILRIDGKYENNKYYTINDMCDIYEKEGLSGLKGYGFLVLSTITEKGDMYGNVDNTFMQNNNVDKLYVYQYIDLQTFLKNHEVALEDLQTNVLSVVENIQLERKISIMISVISLFLIILAVVSLLIVYRELVNREILNQMNKCSGEENDVE